MPTQLLAWIIKNVSRLESATTSLRDCKNHSDITVAFNASLKSGGLLIKVVDEIEVQAIQSN